MKKLKLNSENIAELLTTKRVTADGKNFEIQDNIIIINDNGKITEVTSVLINTADEKDFNADIQRCICDYFNLEGQNVICVKTNNEESVFKIRINFNIEFYIIVVEFEKIFGKDISVQDSVKEYRKYSDTRFAGPYRRLGNTSYFFRLTDDCF